jgi:hypothetical protein
MRYVMTLDILQPACRLIKGSGAGKAIGSTALVTFESDRRKQKLPNYQAPPESKSQSESPIAGRSYRRTARICRSSRARRLYVWSEMGRKLRRRDK